MGGPHSILGVLWDWTPFLARGFAMNILVSVVSMLAGTLFGLVLATLRVREFSMLRGTGELSTALFRNIPSFVFMFYIAFVFPPEFAFGGEIYVVPAWIKATIALTVPVIGFASDNLVPLLRLGRKRRTQDLVTFGVAWTQYFLIIIMASTLASVIGVDEIVARSNIAIAAVHQSEFTLWIYLYVAAWFLVLGGFINGVSRLTLSRLVSIENKAGAGAQ